MRRLNLNNNYTAGIVAEFVAKVYLRLLCYKVLRSRYSAVRGSSAGEVDIIVRRGRTVVFVEVKKRRTIDLAKEAIFLQQKQRIRKSAEAFLAKNLRYAGYDVRFDAMCFDKWFRFEYLKNAF